jgi:hypothetical protein
MKIWLSTMLVLVAFVTGRATSGNIAHPGMAPYTPTKLEWIELQSWIAVKEDTLHRVVQRVESRTVQKFLFDGVQLLVIFPERAVSVQFRRFRIGLYCGHG